MQSSRSENAKEPAVDTQRRGRLLDEQTRSRAPQERGRLMRQFIVPAMNPAKRFRTMCVLMDRAIVQTGEKRGWERGA